MSEVFYLKFGVGERRVVKLEVIELATPKVLLLRFWLNDGTIVEKEVKVEK